VETGYIVDIMIVRDFEGTSLIIILIGYHKKQNKLFGE
jgi:hypothetical protein